MQITFDANELRPIIAQIVSEALFQLNADKADTGEQLAFTEAHAARLLSMKQHQLRDERLRGRIGSSKIVGGQVRYKKSDIFAYLEKTRSETV